RVHTGIIGRQKIIAGLVTCIAGSFTGVRFTGHTGYPQAAGMGTGYLYAAGTYLPAGCRAWVFSHKTGGWTTRWSAADGVGTVFTVEGSRKGRCGHGNENGAYVEYPDHDSSPLITDSVTALQDTFTRRQLTPPYDKS